MQGPPLSIDHFECWLILQALVQIHEIFNWKPRGGFTFPRSRYTGGDSPSPAAVTLGEKNKWIHSPGGALPSSILLPLVFHISSRRCGMNNYTLHFSCEFQHGGKPSTPCRGCSSTLKLYSILLYFFLVACLWVPAWGKAEGLQQHPT